MANPLTCLHRVVMTAFNKNTDEFFLCCTSCDMHLEGRHLEGRLFEYEPDSQVWVYVPRSRVISEAKRATV